MRNKYFIRNFYLIILLLAVFITSCSKTSTTTKPAVAVAKPVTIGMYQLGEPYGARVMMPLAKVGTQTINNRLLVFDTGSMGLVLDATGILPSTMFNDNGIKVTGDSVTVNGVTVTSQATTMSYGDANAPTVAYGNLAYTDVTLGDNNGNITIKHVPFFLYYKALDGNQQKLDPYTLDLIGVCTGVSFTNHQIVSPLSLYNPGTGLTKGFKLGLLNNGDLINTSNKYVYEKDLLSIGLTDADRFTSGFTMHVLGYSSDGGYLPDIPAKITYGSTTTNAEIWFDTGNPQIIFIQDPNANGVKKTLNDIGDLPSGTVVSVTTNAGFKFNYTVNAQSFLSTIENPNQSGDYRSIFSIFFFSDNEYLIDYDHNLIGLKNN